MRLNRTHRAAWVLAAALATPCLGTTQAQEAASSDPAFPTPEGALEIDSTEAHPLSLFDAIQGLREATGIRVTMSASIRAALRSAPVGMIGKVRLEGDDAYGFIETLMVHQGFVFSELRTQEPRILGVYSKGVEPAAVLQYRSTSPEQVLALEGHPAFLVEVNIPCENDQANEMQRWTAGNFDESLFCRTQFYGSGRGMTFRGPVLRVAGWIRAIEAADLIEIGASAPKAPAPVMVPPSSLEATAKVLALIEAVDDQSDSQFYVKNLRSNVDRRRAAGHVEGSHISVSFDLSILGEDSVEATTAYVELLEVLDGQEDCVEVVHQGTKSRDDGQGIDARNVTLTIRQEAREWVAELPEPSVDVVVRKVARDTQEGLKVDVHSSVRQILRGVEDVVHRVQFDGSPARTLAAHLNFLMEVDRALENGSISEITLGSMDRRDEQRGEYNLQFEITSRRASKR